MDSREIVSEEDLSKAADAAFYDGVTRSTGELRLMLLELLVKANAGCRSSHTEEAFLGQFGMIKKDRTANKKGREFMLRMVYRASSKKPECYRLMRWHRL